MIPNKQIEGRVNGILPDLNAGPIFRQVDRLFSVPFLLPPVDKILGED